MYQYLTYTILANMEKLYKDSEEIQEFKRDFCLPLEIDIFDWLHNCDEEFLKILINKITKNKYEINIQNLILSSDEEINHPLFRDALI